MGWGFVLLLVITLGYGERAGQIIISLQLIILIDIISPVFTGTVQSILVEVSNPSPVPLGNVALLKCKAFTRVV